MSFGNYQPTRSLVQWAKVLTFLSSSLSLILLILYPIYLDVTVDIRNTVFLISGALGGIEIFLLFVVFWEFKVLLPIVLGYTTFILFYSSIGFIFCFCFAVIQILSKCDPKTHGKELPMMNFIAAFPVVLVFTILYSLRSLGVWLVYRRSRIAPSGGSSQTKIVTNSLIDSEL